MNKAKRVKGRLRRTLVSVLLVYSEIKSFYDKKHGIVEVFPRLPSNHSLTARRYAINRCSFLNMNRFGALKHRYDRWARTTYSVELVRFNA